MRLLFALTGVLTMAAVVPAQDAGLDQCRRCHEVTTPKIVADHDASVHAMAEIRCVDCHGGDINDRTREGGHNPEKGFSGPIARKDVPAHCASCHSDVEKMKFSRLDTNVLAEWKTSRHGQLFLAGDTRAADCASCHGTHRILARRDPDSPINRRNIPHTCGKCHSDAKRMGDSKLPLDQEKQYLEGIHGSILTGARPGDADLVPTCVDCHGGHGSTPPDVKSVSLVCGNCHFEERMYLRKSAHHNALRRSGKPSCTTCHDNHHNTVPKGGLHEACKSCHNKDDDPAKAVAMRLGKLLVRGSGAVTQLETALANREGDLVDKTRLLLEAQRGRAADALTRVKKEVHGLDEQAVEKTVSEIEGITRTVLAVIAKDPNGSHGFSVSQITWILAVAVLVLLGVSVALTWTLRRVVAKRPHAPTPDGEDHPDTKTPRTAR